MPRGDRTQKLQPRSMDAKINRFETRMRNDTNFAGNQFDDRKFTTDASGFGSRGGEEEFYDIQLNGPQTWSYDPVYDDPKDYDDITIESIMKEMEEDAILYPEGSTPGGMENYFYENEGDVYMHELGEMRPPAFSGSVGTQIRPYNYNEGGIAGLPGGQWSSSTIEGDEEIYDIKPLQMDPGIMSIEDLEDLFEEAGLDKRLIYELINTGGLSQLVA